VLDARLLAHTHTVAYTIQVSLFDTATAVLCRNVRECAVKRAVESCSLLACLCCCFCCYSCWSTVYCSVGIHGLST
jgi:hypothetical protein